MRRVCKVVLVVGVAALLAVPAFAQDQGQGQGRGRGRRGRRGCGRRWRRLAARAGGGTEGHDGEKGDQRPGGLHSDLQVGGATLEPARARRIRASVFPR